MSASYWEERFQNWASPPGETEQDRIENAVTAIQKAMDASDKLAGITKVFVQGSYRNRVNVRQESDVDIGVLYTGGGFYGAYPSGTTRETFGLGGHPYNYSQFKTEIEEALVNKFGTSGVHRGTKAFDIHPNSYRVDADVVPVFEHRRYRPDGTFSTGVQFFPDQGGEIINWPEKLFSSWPTQHYEEGVAKNDATKRAFKGVVRILKKLRVNMETEGVDAAKGVPGFLIECLVHNVPNDRFMYSTWDEVVTRVIRNIWANTKDAEKCSDWREVSGWKWLFKADPDSKRVLAYNFINAAWDYIGVRNYE